MGYTCRETTNKKFNLIYKIIHYDAPSYLSDLLPNRVNEAVLILETIKISKYLFLRLCSFDSSFFPSTLRLWKGLDISVRNSPTLLEFKTNLRNQAQKDKASGILSMGERKLNIILTRIRHNRRSSQSKYSTLSFMQL